MTRAKPTHPPVASPLVGGKPRRNRNSSPTSAVSTKVYRILCKHGTRVPWPSAARPCNQHGEACPRLRLGHGTQNSKGLFGNGTSIRAYTLVELVVVIGVISLLMAVTIPSVSWMWESTRLADAENKLTGLLRSARMRSLNKADSGLFFFIENGVQKIAFIKADPPNLTPNPDGSASVDAGGNGAVGDGDDVRESATADRFRVLTDTVYDLRAPFRVVPIDVLRENAPGVFLWTDEQLGNDHYDNPPDSADNYIHRNFFTLLFSPDGGLLVGRSVLIRDGDAVTGGTRERGAITTLTINDAGDFYDETGNSTPVPMPTPELPAMIVDVDDVALNFPSVDGLLVYDDTLFRGYPDDAVEPVEDKRRFLMRTARPFYISRQTGAIIKGPLGENEP